MNIEEIQELNRGDLVRDRVTGAIFKVCQVDCYPDEFESDGYVSIPLRIELVYLPEGIEYIRTGGDDGEIFEKVGEHDYVYYDMESYHNAEVVYANERILTCQDLERTTMEKILKPENVVSFKNEGLIEMQATQNPEESEIPDDLIFPVEQARENFEKMKTLRTDILAVSQLIKEASLQGKKGVKIPAELDRLEITTRFMRAGYNIYAGCIAW